MLIVPTHTHRAVDTARATGTDALDTDTLATLRRRYRGTINKGSSDNQSHAGPLTANGAALARRFRDHETMILRFVVDLAVPFTKNQRERDLRPVKIQQRSSGGAWRTLDGLADCAIVRCYLSTATNGA